MSFNQGAKVRRPVDIASTLWCKARRGRSTAYHKRPSDWLLTLRRSSDTTRRPKAGDRFAFDNVLRLSVSHRVVAARTPSKFSAFLCRVVT